MSGSLSYTGETPVMSHLHDVEGAVLRLVGVVAQRVLACGARSPFRHLRLGTLQDHAPPGHAQVAVASSFDRRLIWLKCALMRLRSIIRRRPAAAVKFRFSVKRAPRVLASPFVKLEPMVAHPASHAPCVLLPSVASES